MLCVVATTVKSAEVEEEDAPIVSTQEGLVLGLQESSTKGRSFYSYYSIPFAKPPVKELRFKDPVPASRWDGVLDGRTPSPLCLQLPFATIATGNTTVLGQEDCLYLNVFTHKPNEVEAKSPVMVYIHGGGYFGGGTSRHPPYVLMNEDIVLVTIQYRLGILGFLSTEDSVIPGNFGLKDQTEALRWVSRNIVHFGGDPSRVTIFGESAGAGSVHFQILTPKSNGLFARAIMQSGSAICPWSLGAAHREVAQHTSKLVNCSTDTSLEMLQCLQKASGQQLVLTILEYFKWLYLPLLLGPRVDGDFLPADPNVLMRDENYQNVDIISGITSHEGGLACLIMYSKDHVRKALMEDFRRLGPVVMDFNHLDYMPLPSAQTIFYYYLGGLHVDHDNADRVVKMFSDRSFAVCHDLTTKLHARNANKHKTFRYELEYRGQHSLSDVFNLTIAKHWVTHADDLIYLFTGGVFLPLTNPKDLKLRDVFTKLWTNFAATGHPTPDDSLGFQWEPSSETNLHYLSLSPTPVMKPDNREEVREFFATLPTHQNQILDDRFPPSLVTPPHQPLTSLPASMAPHPTPEGDIEEIHNSSPNENKDKNEMFEKPAKLPRDEL